MVHIASACSSQCYLAFYSNTTKTDHTISVYLALYVCETAKKSSRYQKFMTDNSLLFLKQMDGLFILYFLIVASNFVISLCPRYRNQAYIIEDKGN